MKARRNPVLDLPRPETPCYKLTLDVDYVSSSSSTLSENGDIGFAVAVVFRDLEDTEPLAYFTTSCQVTAEYIPGQLYRRELPCLKKVLEKVSECMCRREPLRDYFDMIFVDGFAVLEPGRPGLGAHLRMCLEEDFGGPVPVIGVAKHYFRNCTSVACTVYRGEAFAGKGESECVVPPRADVSDCVGRPPGNPLYVTEVGFSGEDSSALCSPNDCLKAARIVFRMGGPYRLPAMIKHADTISRLEWRDALK